MSRSRFTWILRNLDTKAVYQLERDPKGWEELSMKLYRSDTYHGIFMEPSAKSLSFFRNGGGQEFIEAIYTTKDINGNIELSCKAGSLQLFTCKLNLASYTNDGTLVTINIEQSDLYQKILSRADINVNLESSQSIGAQNITPATVRNLTLPAMVVKLNNYWKTNDITIGAPNEYHPVNTNTYGGIVVNTTEKINIEMNEAFSVANSFVVTEPPTALEDTDISPIFSFNNSDFIASGDTFQLKYKYKGEFNISAPGSAGATFNISGNAKLKVAHGKELGSVDIDTLFTLSWNETATTGFTINVDEEDSHGISLTYGEHVWVYWEIENNSELEDPPFGGGPASYDIQFFFDFYDNSELNLSIDSEYPDSLCKSVLIHEAFNQVADAIADSDGNFMSSFYGRTDSAKRTYIATGKGALLAITNGINIRQQNNPILLSLNSLFNAANAIHNVGLGIVNGRIVVEPLSFFYNSSVKLLELANVDKIVTANDNSRYVNSVKIGYEKWPDSFRGGLDDPFGKREYSTILNSLKNVYQKYSSFLASSYAIEATRRRNIAVTATEAWPYDNDNFWIALKAGYGVEKYADSFSSGSGIQSLTSSYNLRLSPARMLLAHFGNIVAGLQKINGLVKFVTGEGSYQLSVKKTNVGAQEDYAGNSLTENQSFNWNDASVKNKQPLWLPEVYTLQVPITDEQFVAMQANPYGFIQFYTQETAIRQGYILEASCKLSNGMTQFKLLRKYGH